MYNNRVTLLSGSGMCENLLQVSDFQPKLVLDGSVVSNKRGYQPKYTWQTSKIKGPIYATALKEKL